MLTQMRTLITLSSARDTVFPLGRHLPPPPDPTHATTCEWGREAASNGGRGGKQKTNALTGRGQGEMAQINE